MKEWFHQKLLSKNDKNWAKVQMVNIADTMRKDLLILYVLVWISKKLLKFSSFRTLKVLVKIFLIMDGKVISFTNCICSLPFQVLPEEKKIPIAVSGCVNLWHDAECDYKKSSSCCIHWATVVESAPQKHSRESLLISCLNSSHILICKHF